MVFLAPRDAFWPLELPAFKLPRRGWEMFKFDQTLRFGDPLAPLDRGTNFYGTKRTQSKVSDPEFALQIERKWLRAGSGVPGYICMYRKFNKSVGLK